MRVRLLPWAILAAVVLGLAVTLSLPGKSAPGAAARPGAAEFGAEIRLAPVDLRELHDDGTWNRLTAEEATYGYARKTVKGTGVVVSFGEGAFLEGSVIRAPAAFWDLEGKSISLPQGGHADREGGWTGELSAAAIDLTGRVLYVPGPAEISGPGFTVAGTNLVWKWQEGKVTMDAPKSRIAPKVLPKGKG